jgi:hypothetical protein
MIRDQTNGDGYGSIAKGAIMSQRQIIKRKERAAKAQAKRKAEFIQSVMDFESGSIESIRTLTNYGMQVYLKNGVSISIGFNNGYVHLSFSGISFKPDGLSIQEAKNLGVKLPLANYVNIDYKPRTK